MSLRKQRQSLYCTVMSRAWTDAGEDVDDPGEVTQYLDRLSGLMLIEFDGTQTRDVKQVYRPDDNHLVVEFDDA
jgi:hypothetical protein